MTIAMLMQNTIAALKEQTVESNTRPKVEINESDQNPARLQCSLLCEKCARSYGQFFSHRSD